MNILKNIKAVIFDLDGTLVDSMWMWKSIDVEYLSMLDVEMPDDLQKCIGGMSFYETAVYFKERFSITSSIDEIMKIWNEMALKKYSHEVPLKPDVLNFLEEIRKRNIKLGIATSNSDILTNAVLKAHKISDFFESVITGHEAGAGKPAPDIYLKSAKKLNVAPEDCLVFEDLSAGIMAGKAAGMKVCGVHDNYSEYEESLKRELADYYINSYKQVLMNEFEVLS